MIRRGRLAPQLLLVAVITLVPLHEDPKRPNGSVEDNPCPAYRLLISSTVADDGEHENVAMGYDAGKRFMPDLNPEQRAREHIDSQLLACGWVVQDYRMARQI